jgi:uncharacterized membrane protein YqjE
MNRSGDMYQGSTETNSDSDTIGGLLSGLLRDVQQMVRGEMALARAEIKDDVSTIGTSIASLAIATIFALTGFILLMLGVTYVLNMYMRMWIAAGIVGLVLLAIGGMLAMAAKKKLSAASLKPDQTIDSLKETKTWAQQQMNSGNR